MKIQLQRFDIKRKTAGFMALVLTIMAFLPYFPESMVSFGDYDQTIEQSSWPHGIPANTGPKQAVKATPLLD